MDVLIWVVIGLVVLAGAYFLFRKSTPAQLDTSKPTALPDKPKPGRERPPREEKPTVADLPSHRPKAAEPEAEPEAEPDIPVEADDEPLRPSLTHTRDVSSLRKGLAKSRGAEGFFGRLKALFTGKKELDPDVAEQIEEVLISSDVGVQTTAAMLSRLRESLDRGDLLDTSKVWETLREQAREILDVDGQAGAFPLRGKPTVVLMVGVNGAGKTTTIGKLATKLEAEGRKCVLAAGDTFRAAAVQQLIVWGKRIGCEVVHGKDGADPASVIFDAIKRAQELDADVVLADTAGRLHTKTNLMTEMTKIAKTAGKALDGAPHEILLVIDATNGQNALAQAREFKEALPLSGLVLTKLDGTAKGGVVLGISDSLKLPVRFIGLGERPHDLHDFSPDEFVEALLGKESEANAA
jgi:fused signal recognition particle receptor